MKNRAIFLLSFLWVAYWECSWAAEMPQITTSSSLNEVLSTLDYMVENRQDYIDAKEAVFSHKKELLAVASDSARCVICLDMVELYDGYNTDSTLFYAQQAEQLAWSLNDTSRAQRAQIYTGRCLAINGMYEHAQNVLYALAETVREENKVLYYKACNSMYVWSAEFTTIPEEKVAAWSHIPQIRDSLLCHETDPLWLIQEQALAVSVEHPEEAIALLLPAIKTLPVTEDHIRYLCNTIGSAYDRINQRDSALYYYALSAICDMACGVMEHASLREVALLLYRSENQEDIARAYRYMNCCIEDAQFCQARLRTLEMARDMPVILAAYQEAMAKQQDSLRTVIIGLILAIVLLLGLAVFALVMQVRMRKAKQRTEMAKDQLHEANERLQEALLQLQTSNKELEESNRIRAAYVTQYMRECSESGIQLEDYHQSLLRVATHSNYQQLLEAIRSTKVIEQNRKVFYQHFDETFLSLFPHFIEKVNTLLLPDQQFAIPEHNSLSTELRILALIRLGVTSSDDIARFLRCSTKTVHNYRAAIRNRAQGTRSTLDSQIVILCK